MKFNFDLKKALSIENIEKITSSDLDFCIVDNLLIEFESKKCLEYDYVCLLFVLRELIDKGLELLKLKKEVNICDPEGFSIHLNLKDKDIIVFSDRGFLGEAKVSEYFNAINDFYERLIPNLIIKFKGLEPEKHLLKRKEYLDLQIIEWKKMYSC